MTRSSPWRRSQVLSSPDRASLSDFLAEDRNNELNHRDALAAAQAEHERVRDAAVRVFELYEMNEEYKRIVEAERREHERLAAEAKIAAEEQRLQELRAKSVPKPAPPPPPDPRTQPEPIPKPQEAGIHTKTSDSGPTSQQWKQAPGSSTPAPPQQPTPAPVPVTAQSNGARNLPQTQMAATTPFGLLSQKATPGVQTNGLLTNSSPFAAAATTAQTPSKPQPQASQPLKAATSDRYAQIHKELKRLRTSLQNEARNPGSPLKGQLGTFRREIRVSIGQLTSGLKGANTKPISKITEALRLAVEGKVPSPPIDVSVFVLDQRQPAEGAVNNEATMPALFIYLMNICAKGIINQFINECGANPKAADPIGVVAAHIFSQKEFLWRGSSLIDILMAKFRVVCPALFGHRGNENTERGRLALGWKKDEGRWVPEQTHRDRMAGLGAGFASLSLRDFSKSSKTNPYPPTHYWKALAYIINTPSNETSNTQYVVLRAMIEGHERRFLNFYGNAGFAALRLALVEFPKKAPPKSAAAGSLQALAELLRAEEGFALT